MLLHDLKKKGLIQPPPYLPDNTHYLTLMGSVAYGVSSDTSDSDVYGFCVPHKDMVFPHLRGEIMGFGRQKERFEQWQQHHVKDESARKEYDFSVYNIVKYFHLCMENNPNMVDSLFTPRRCVLHTTQIGERVREHRKLFLHRGAFPKFKGYAYAQMNAIGKRNTTNPKRMELVEKFGYDTKFAYHVVRLANECEQILDLHDLDLEANREQLKSIRRGEWTLDELKDWFTKKEKHLEDLNAKSTLRNRPDEEAIKALLLECLEMHYGSLSEAIRIDPDIEAMARDLREVLNRYVPQP